MQNAQNSHNSRDMWANLSKFRLIRWIFREFSATGQASETMYNMLANGANFV